MLRKSPHLLLPPRCLSRAMSRHFIKVSLSNGLLGKQIAPAFSARARTASSEKAVMKMMVVSLREQEGWQLDAAHGRHLDIRNHARRVAEVRRP
jgi:hypothetical protein